MYQYDPYQLSNLIKMQTMQALTMPQQPIPPDLYQARQPMPMSLTAAPSMMYQQPSSQGLQVPPGYNYDPRTGTQYGQQQGGSNNPQYTYPGGILGSGAYRPYTG